MASGELQNEDVLQEAIESLSRVQEFNVESLEQKTRLGSENSFEEVLEPARALLGIFQQIPSSTLELFPDNELNQIKSISDAAYNLFSEILSFSLSEGDVENRRKALIDKVRSQIQPAFTKLHSLVSFAMAKTVDFANLERQARGTIQAIRDQTDRILAELEENKQQAELALDAAQKAAAEQGVVQQAKYFKEEADTHEALAEFWRKWTLWTAAGVGVYGALTLFIHKWSWLAPKSSFETFQVITAKLLVFFVLTFLLFLCSKNFLSNRHNAIVNRHRQNALMTYRALVEASGTPEARDTVLSHAAAAIFQLHDTGYVKAGDNSGASTNNIVEMLPRSTLPISTGQ
ncbi:MAG: hypothetical protein P1U75_03745 [Antarcticimicrobium sp.]|uniref:hypothetical protein n=1 Tax=Antarcticimicrobium sp. TaxID=2824147 RepID=UPI00260E70E9|nr:hypothetical protein [Antarcticimicrobium sp.]MDF1715778.1 hypothetical protein [Antarcticimicrobium sp.]